MRPALAIPAALPTLLALGVAQAADPTLLAETGGFLLGNAHRCGVSVERVERSGKVIHNVIIAAAEDKIRAWRRLRIHALMRFSWRALSQTEIRRRFRLARW